MKLTLTLFLTLFFLVSLPLQASEIEIQSIVLSKNCLESLNPETYKEALANPECPKVDEPLLIQVALFNTSKASKRVGVQIQIEHDQELIEPQPPRSLQTLPALENTRILQSFQVPKKGGVYRISAKVIDPQSNQVLAVAGDGVIRKFGVVGEDTLKAIQEEEEAKKKESLNAKPKQLQFDPPDLRWEMVQVLPKHVIRGEPIRVRLRLINVGGDIARDVKGLVEYFNVRLPRRKTPIASPEVMVLAPGESATFEVEYLLADNELLGEYQILANADPDKLLRDLNRNNNQAKSNTFLLNDIKLFLPAHEFKFESNGLFFFQWDSLQYGEFKVQIGVDEGFDQPENYFELPQGDRWIADKELVPLAGELPAMAVGLMKTHKVEFLYWRVVGRKSDGTQAHSNVRIFQIKDDSISTD